LTSGAEKYNLQAKISTNIAYGCNNKYYFAVEIKWKDGLVVKALGVRI